VPSSGDREYKIFYDIDLDDVDYSITNTVTVTGSSRYDYGASLNNEVTEDESFTVTFLNPCIDPAHI